MARGEGAARVGRANLDHAAVRLKRELSEVSPWPLQPHYSLQLLGRCILSFFPGSRPPMTSARGSLIADRVPTILLRREKEVRARWPATKKKAPPRDSKCPTTRRLQSPQTAVPIAARAAQWARGQLKVKSRCSCSCKRTRPHHIQLHFSTVSSAQVAEQQPTRHATALPRAIKRERVASLLSPVSPVPPAHE